MPPSADILLMSFLEDKLLDSIKLNGLFEGIARVLLAVSGDSGR